MKKHTFFIKIKKKSVKRIISFATAFVLLTNSAPLPDMSDMFHFDLFSSNISAMAESVMEEYEPTQGMSYYDDEVRYKYNANTDTKVMSLENANEFIDYCYFYKKEPSFANRHQSDKIEFTDFHAIYSNFMGLGSEEYPFKGTLVFSGSGSNSLVAPCALFSHVYDSVRMIYNTNDNKIEDTCMQMIRGSQKDKDSPIIQITEPTGALIAENVYHDIEGTRATWKVEAIDPDSRKGTPSDYGGVIGEMHDGASVILEFTNSSSVSIYDDGDVGLFCGKMDSGSILNVTYTGNNTIPPITSTGRNAGGLVGVMEDDASLTVSTIPSSINSIIAQNGYAGGLVGDMRPTATITNISDSSTILSISIYKTTDAIIEGGNGAGGLYGRLLNTGNNTLLDISNYNIDVTLDGKYAGGLIGVLENGTTGNESTTEKYEIKDKDYSTSASTVTSAYKSGTDYTTGYYGGMIGRYIATDLSDELYIHNVKASSNSQSAIYAYGGAVGLVDNVSYIKAEDVDIIAKHSNARETDTPKYAFFGGLVGATNKNYDNNNNNNSKAVFVDMGKFTLIFNKSDNTVDTTDGYKGGGIVGQFYKGVLRLSGNTNLSNAKTCGDYDPDNTKALRYSQYGQLVGYNDDVLVYAADGWSFTRYNGSIADDLGTWGEVVRGQEGKAITYDSDRHTVSVAAPVFTMSTADDFVKTALNIQLNDGTDYNGVMTFSNDSNNKKSELLEGNLSLSNDISLAGTGINGLMRDGIATGEFDESKIGDVGVFTGTFEGGGKTITLAIGDNGNGAIYRHRLNGLFAVVGGNATIEKLTIAGTENIRNAAPNGMTVGGVAARVHGSVKLENITAQQTINYYEGTTSAPSGENLGKNLGGVAGYVDKTENQTISITGTNTLSTKFKFSGNHNNWLCYGALIGKIVSPSFTVNIAQSTGEKLTASYEMINDTVTIDGVTSGGVTSYGSMADGGGLIGYITRCSGNNSANNRKVNIKNTEFKDSKDLNIATTAGGGLLGFAWLDTEVEIDGITTSGATINSMATNVGALAYMASGKWTVNSVDLTNLTVTGGATDSLGMLVNRAYDNGESNNGKYKDKNDKDQNTTNGLYINLLKAGYALTTTTTNNATTTTTNEATTTTTNEATTTTTNEATTTTTNEATTTTGNATTTGNETTTTTTATISYNISVSPAKFDEIAAYTADTPENVLQGGDKTGIISINMNSNGDNKVKITDTGTYQNQLFNADKTNCPNNTARYYYNLNNMSNNDPTQDVMLWSVKQYAAKNLGKYFEPSDSPLKKSTPTDVDLSGYSFYPVYKGDGVTVENINFTFDYSGIYTAENNITFNTDSYNRDPGNNGTDSYARNQHFLMQSGLFITVSAGSKVQFDTVKLSGYFLEIEEYDIGDNKTMSYQGVLISDTAKGDVKINGLVLDGIVPKKVGNADYKNGYMLINKVRRDTVTSPTVSLNINNVSNTDKYTVKDNNNNYISTDTVTKSLFGTVEGPTINISLGSIKLDSRITSSALSGAAKTALDNAYGTVNSIFTDSTLFYSIKTNKLASLTYNYEYEKDHGSETVSATRWVTYGKEINDTQEYIEYINDENFISKQLKYYNSAIYTNPTIPSESNIFSSAYDFRTNYLRYVHTGYSETGENSKNTPDSNGLYFREIAVNVPVNNDITGCGTYNDPYRITKGEDLEKIAAFLYGKDDMLNKIDLPKNISTYNSLDKNAKGNRWCTDNHATYTYQDVNGTYKFKANGVNGADDWTIDQVRMYLENAYYVLGDSTHTTITLGEDFEGLGGSENDNSGKYAFRGVIIGGDKETDNTTKITIINNSSNPLVSISNGCVVKDLSIVQNKEEIELNQNAKKSDKAAFGYTRFINETSSGSGCRYYGGVIGEIMGGDNIIDNCYVTQADNAKVKLTGSAAMLCPVGSYVGVVVFGGLIFKNIKANPNVNPNANANAANFKVYYNTNTTDNLNDKDKKGAIYVNPFVGRVINGYAVNETNRFSVTEDGFYHDGETNETSTARTGNQHSLKNTKKHYTIADIDKSEINKLNVSRLSTGDGKKSDGTIDQTKDGIIDIPNSQAFFILSLITQSGSGTATKADTNTAWAITTGTDNTLNSNNNYSNSLSYGLSGSTVRGMSHTANYDLVGKTTEQPEDYYQYAAFDTAANTAVPYIIEHYTVKTGATNNPDELSNGDKIVKSTVNGKKQYTVTKGTYNARCVTMSANADRFYDINLTNTTTNYVYQLPDSFRGLGCVGRTSVTQYCMKVNVFNGNSRTIDEDIYINRFDYDADNYFDNYINTATTQSAASSTTEYNYNHDNRWNGIGLFDVIYMKSGTIDANDNTKFFDEAKDSQLRNFTLTGSVKAESYTLGSNPNGSKPASSMENSNKWLACGGVVGYTTNGTWCIFNKINLSNLSLYGPTSCAGLLGGSGLKYSSPYKWIIVNECGATNISLETTHMGEVERTRDGVAGLVGRVWEGGVKINGGDNGSTVSIKKAVTPDLSNKSTPGTLGDKWAIAAGLITYAGNGCTVMNMTVKSAGDTTVTLGNSGASMAAGVVGVIQPTDKSSPACHAYFENIHIENLNFEADIAGGIMAGSTASRGYVGGVKAYTRTPYTITINNCSVEGKEKDDKNIITADIFAGGFIGDGSVSATGTKSSPNIKIHGSKLKNYTITSKGDRTYDTKDNKSKVTTHAVTGYVGGFIGNTSCNTEDDGSGDERPIICSVFDSSIEYCVLGTVNTVYTGGVLGCINNIKTFVTPKNTIKKEDSDMIVGYNVKLDHVTTQAGDHFGKWIGFLHENNDKDIVQLVGLGIYDCEFGDSNNVAQGKFAEESFVYADYSNTNKNMSKENKKKNKATYNVENDVGMPKYPYVNVNPQSDMGSTLVDGKVSVKVISGDGAVLNSEASGTSDYSGKTAENTMALKIFEELDDAEIKGRYTIFANKKDAAITTTTNTENETIDVKIDDYFKRTTETDGDRISTYQTERGNLPTGVDDFACIVIANTDDNETTNLINRYIQLVTNTVTDYTVDSAYFGFNISTCELKDGYFQKGATTTDVRTNPGLKYEDNKFKLVMRSADSLTPNRFTLLDVQFYDPLTVGRSDTTAKVAYHLYIPIYTIKQMTYDFYAALKTGTYSVAYGENGAENSNKYMEELEGDKWTDAKIHLDSFDTWVTTYLRYGYNKDDINGLLSNGNVNWAHAKSAYLLTSEDSGNTPLPDNTYMILVDKNNGNDKVYYARGSDFTKVKLDNNATVDVNLELSKFKDKDGTKYFSPVELSKLIEDEIRAAHLGSGQSYKQCTTPPTEEEVEKGGYVYVKNGDYRGWFQYVGDNTGTFKLTIPNNNGDYIYEDYYISIYVPKPDSDETYHFYNVTNPGMLAAPAENNKAKAATININKNYKTLIGNLFEQTTDELIVKPEDQQITPSNKTFDIFVTSSIYLKNGSFKNHLTLTNQDVLHGLNIYLDRYDESGGVENDIYGLESEDGENRIQAWYSTGEFSDENVGTPANVELTENQITIRNLNINKDILKETSEVSPQTIYSKVKMIFDDDKLEDEFPEKKGEAGVKVRVTSQIAYDETTISTSNMSKKYPDDTHKYYIESLNSASLNYNEISYTIPEVEPFDEYDKIGKLSENYSRLGVNGLDSEQSAMPIKTNGTYNASILSTVDTEKAERLHLKFTLCKKEDTKDDDDNITMIDYGNTLDLSEYLSGEIKFKSESPFEKSITPNSGDKCIEVDIPKSQLEKLDDNIYRFSIDFNAITGGSFKDYANYRINLHAELQYIDPENKVVTVDNSSADAELIYTNAKVNHEFFIINN